MAVENPLAGYAAGLQVAIDGLSERLAGADWDKILAESYPDTPEEKRAEIAADFRWHNEHPDEKCGDTGCESCCPDWEEDSLEMLTARTGESGPS